MLTFCLHMLTLTVLLPCCVKSNPHAKRLYTDLLVNSSYSKLVRPVANYSDTLTVKLGLRLSQLIGIDEKNQIMTTNVWLSQEWTDIGLTWNPQQYGGVDILYVPSEEIWLPDIVLYNNLHPLQEWTDVTLTWKPEDYGGVDHLYVPAEELWKPDIVLYNNADGNYQVTLMTKATVHSSGRVVWEPPAIYKSSCNIDVEFFPFDVQTCGMKFSSWAYVGALVDLKHINQADVPGEVDIPMAMDLSGYYRSFIWDVMSVPARRNEVYYPCCPEFYPDVTFKIQIRRKTLFYTVNLIIPCVAISFLTVMVFYLPSDSGEKITLCISILLSLTVFFLLLADLIPPTSLVVPLIGKYLLFTMILVTLSIIITVVVLNIHNRTPNTHTMTPWVKFVFLYILPRLLLMKRPTTTADSVLKAKKRTTTEVKLNGNHRAIGQAATGPENEALLAEHAGSSRPAWDLRDPQTDEIDGPEQFSSELSRAMEGVKFIVNHLKEEDEEQQILEDWKYVAMVIDRLFLWLFTTACVVGTFGIILQAPALYDKTKPMDVGI